MVGMTYSAPARIPVGQRAVTVLRRVWKRTPSLPCPAMSPNKERFPPPTQRNAVGGEDRDGVDIFVVVDELCRAVEIGGAHDRQNRPEDLFLIDAHLGLDLVEQAAAEEKPVLVTLQFEAAAVDDELGAFLDAE